MTLPPHARVWRATPLTAGVARPPRVLIQPHVGQLVSDSPAEDGAAPADADASGDSGVSSGDPTPTDVAATPAVELVPDGHWTIDPDHSSVGFVVHHLGITRLRGRFADLTGTINAVDGGIDGTATVAANSVQTGSDARDRHLKGPDFLNVEVHPRLVFTLDGVEAKEQDFAVRGTITINGITRPIEFTAVSGGMAKDPYGHDRVGMSLAARISRRDFDIAFDPTGALVSDAVAIEIDLSLVRQPEYLRETELHQARTAG